MYGWDILCGIAKGNFENPHKIFYPYIERFDFHTKLKFWELLDLRAHMWFWNTPSPGDSFMTQWTESFLVHVISNAYWLYDALTVLVNIVSGIGLLLEGTKPFHKLNQSWFTINWTSRNKLLWNFSLSTRVFIQENAIVVWYQLILPNYFRVTAPV